MFYALGDIHGFTDQLDRALALIAADGGADAPLYFVGDFVDRGADSRGVIQQLIDGQAAGRPWHFIAGNHDLMFLDFMTTGNVDHAEIKSRKSWINKSLGGMTTLASYADGAQVDHPDWPGWDAAKENGIDPISDGLKKALRDTMMAAVPQAHLDWIAGLPLWIDGPDNHRFVHAGIRPGVPMSDQTRSDLIWIRDGWLDHEGPLDRMYVHGHTALDFPEHHGNRINLDGGCAYGRPLVPCGFDGTAWFTLDDTGRSPLRP